MIQVIYSPKTMVIQKKSSRMQLNNLKTEKYERCCTFDGPDYYSIQQNIKSDLAQELQSIVKVIIEKYNRLRFSSCQNLVLKMHLYFKLDQHNQIWFLYAGGFHSREDKKGFSPPIEPEIFIQDQDKHMKITQKSDAQTYLTCLKCAQKESSKNFCPVTYQQIIEECNSRKAKEDAVSIPPRPHPRTTNQPRMPPHAPL